MGKFILTGFADEISANLDEQIQGLRDLHIQYIELRTINGKNVSDYTPEEMVPIKEKLDAAGIRVSAIGSPIGKIKITDNPDADLAKFKNTLALAKVLETKYIRMFSFYIDEQDDPAVYRDEVIKRWQAYLRLAEGTGVMLLHENEKRIYGDTAERSLDLLETLQSPIVGATFDPANFVQCSVSTYPEAFHLLEKHIVYMHIKDADGMTVVPAGMGKGHIKEILSALKGKDMFLSLEPHLANFTGFSSLEQGDKKLAEGGNAEKFALAVKSLRSILKEIGAEEA
ncbi:MAG: TIM barrel protein [Clostridia bacterium]|nr:TIM barrel protein [Clostridia bacterium]